VMQEDGTQLTVVLLDGMEDGMEDAGAIEARVVVAMAAVTFLRGDWCIRWLSCCNGDHAATGS